MADAAKTQQTDEQKAKVAKDRRDAYTEAQATLREQHRDEFNSLFQGALKKRGIEWQPPLTEEQKAEQEYRRLIEKFPHLAGTVVSEASEEVGSEPPPEGSEGWQGTPTVKS